MNIFTSKQFTLNWRDLLKGLIMAIGTPVLYLIQEMIPGWNLDPIAQAALSALITYLLKNFFAPPTVVVPAENNQQAQEIKESLNK